MKKPNLFIIGAMKSGTTSLHHYLSTHPQMFMSEPKEPGFFKLAERSEEEWQAYLEIFAEANETHLYVGEGSTDYAKIPQYEAVSDRLKEFSPDAKIIYVMRNPWKRTISHYWHTRRPQVTGGQTRNFDAAFAEFEGYQSFSDYPMQIEPFIELFGRENIHFTVFEDLIGDPRAELDKIFAFLNLSNEFDYSVVDDKLNARPEKVMSATGSGLMHKLSYSGLWSVLAKIIPKSVKTKLRGMAIKEVDPKSQDPFISATLQQQREVYEDIIKRTSSMLDRDLSEIWKL